MFLIKKACISSYSLQHILIHLIEEWRQKLDNDHVVVAVLMGVSKAFACIPHDLLVVKLSVYSLSDKALAYIFLYLCGRKQSVKINNFCTILQLIYKKSIKKNISTYIIRGSAGVNFGTNII